MGKTRIFYSQSRHFNFGIFNNYFLRPKIFQLTLIENLKNTQEILVIALFLVLQIGKGAVSVKKSLRICTKRIAFH